MKDKPVILVVDDDPQSIELFEAYLVPEGYEIVKAANGKEGLGKLSGNQIDLILLDVMMANMDGFEFARKVRQDNTHRLLPIILVSILREPKDRAKGIEAGCNDFISKPVDKIELIARVRSLLKIKDYNDLMSNYRKELEFEVTRRTEELKHALEKIQQDITKRKQAEEELQESEERFRTAFNNAAIGIALMANDGYFLEVNHTLCRILGYSEEELLGKTWVEITNPDDLPRCYDWLKQVKAGEQISHEKRFIHKLGHPVWIEVSSSLVRDSHGRIRYYISLFQDIAERKQAEEDLRRSERELSIKNRIADIFITISEEEMYGEVLNVVLDAMKSPYGTFSYINEDGDRIVPSMTRDIWDECKISDKGKFFPRKNWGDALWAKCLIEKKSFMSNGPFTFPSGHVPISRALATPIIHQGQSIGNFMVGNKSTDYTEEDRIMLEAIADRVAPILYSRLLNKRYEKERKRGEDEKKVLETQLLQAQKMESIGNLAGGIAHDFNNILTSVIGFTELSLDEVEKGSHIEDNLQEVYTAGNRAKDLVRQILAFARQSEEELKPIQVDKIATEVLKFIRSSIPTTIEIKQNIESDSLIMGNATQVHQILMNLFTNAAHAMEVKGGILEFSLKDVVMDRGVNRENLDLKPGNYIEIKVSDTGEGIAPEIIGAIFDPYFTTKGPGEGTGMGLAMVHGIVESYGGKILVDSKPGQGTLFTIYLPVTRKRQEHRPFQPETLPTGTERILLVDDEAPIAKIGGQTLERLGYTVSIRTSSIEALELFRSKPNDFDLVITDMTMPNMTGDKLAVELMKIRSDIPVIICTGYSKTISDDSATEIGIKAFTYKPIVRSDLAKTVRKVLDAGRSKA